MNKRKRLAKLEADAASYVADMKAFGDDIRAATEAGLPDVADGNERAAALNAPEDAIYQEADALGATDAEFMREVHARATGPLAPNRHHWDRVIDQCRDEIGSEPFTMNGLIALARKPKLIKK